MIKKYMQTDPRWANNDYSAKGEKTTIGKSGCGPTALAMVVATLADPSATPATLCKWALRNGYKAPNQGTYYSYFEPQAKLYGLTVDQINGSSVYHNPNSVSHEYALSELKKGNWIIACMGKGRWTSSGHFILVHKVDGLNVHIYDPNSTAANRECARISDWQNEVKYYFSVKVPSSYYKEDEDMTETEVKALLKGDTTKTSDWAKPVWSGATSDKIVDGSRPGGYATREEVVQIVENALRAAGVEK